MKNQILKQNHYSAQGVLFLFYFKLRYFKLWLISTILKKIIVLDTKKTVKTFLLISLSCGAFNF